MPGRVRFEELERAGRAKIKTKIADRDTRCAPARTRSARDPEPTAGRWCCLTCALRSDSEAAAARHAAAVRHPRYTDLGMGL